MSDDKPNPVESQKSPAQPSEPAIGDSQSQREALEETKIAGGEVAGIEGDPSLPKSFGRYEVRGLLGRGGFGTVYLGYDTQLQRNVAIKAPRVDINSESVTQSFLDEARQLARLHHPGIVSVFDVGVEGDSCYVVSDFLDGPNLKSWLNAVRPTWQQSVKIAMAIAEALAHAHAQRIVHRDLKPGNVILTQGLVPVIVDYGLALSDRQMTGLEKGRIAGTPTYMSPEQARGEGHRIDGRTDVYSLGTILYRMLTGREPFRAASAEEVIRQVKEDEPQPPRQLARDIPPEVERICLKAMAKRFKERYMTADDMVLDLRRVLEGLEGSATIDFPSEVPVAPEAVTATAAPVAVAAPAAPPVVAERASDEAQAAEAPSASSLRRAREAVRRRVTVVQCGCDVFESDLILETLDEEEQNELLVEFQSLCRDVALKLGGHVVQQTNEGMLLCFGFPDAVEDATRRAVRAALEVREQMVPFNARLRKLKGLALATTVAAHSDYAVVEAKDETDTLSLVGQVRNVVNQLILLADPESVVISQATHRLVRGYFECESLGVHKLKGLGKVEVYQALREQAVERIDAAEIGGDLTPLVGRDREVGLLEERWEQAAEGMGQVVLLIGDAGLGKSRLVHVLKEHVRSQDDSDGDPVIEWRTTQHHQNSSLFPAIECFERLLRFERQTPPADRLDRLVEHLAGLELDGDEEIALLASLLAIPLAGRFPPLEMSPQEQKEKTLAILLDWLHELSNDRPILFVVEDLHWADPTTLAFLEDLVDQGLNDRILTLLTFRPEFETPWKSKAHQTSIALNRLTKRQVGEMIVARAGVREVAPNLVDEIIERTDGVPLYVEEFTAMIVETSRPNKTAPDESSLSGTFTPHEIPATLQDLLMARLDRIAGNVELVQLASCIGREFHHEVIAAVANLPEEDLVAELELLVSSDLLHQRGRPPRTRYTFKHALLQDAAYQSLIRKKRHELHARIASALEDGFPETCRQQPELLAHHFTEANIPDRAVSYWEQAAAHSLAQYAHAETIGHLTRGLEVLQELGESAERNQREVLMRIRLGVPLQAIHGYSAPIVRQNYDRARELSSQIGDVDMLFPVLYGLFRYDMLQAEYAKATEMGEQLLKLTEQSQNPGYIVAANRALGAPLVYQGQHARALPHLEKVLSIPATPELRAESYTYDVVDPWITTRCYLAWATWMLGYPDQALEHSREALAAAEELRHPFSVALALSFSQWLHEFRGDAPRTLKAAQEGIALAEERGFAFWIGWGRVMQGWAMSQQGDATAAVAEIRGGIEHWRAQGSALGGHYFYCLLADACLQAGQFEDGLVALDEAQQFSDATREAYYAPEIPRLRGELLLRQSPSDAARAEGLFHEALERARGQNAKSLELRAALSLAELWHRQEKAQNARELLESLCNWFTEGLDTRDLKRARELLVLLASNQK